MLERCLVDPARWIPAFARNDGRSGFLVCAKMTGGMGSCLRGNDGDVGVLRGNHGQDLVCLQNN